VSGASSCSINPRLGGDQARGKRTFAQGCSSVMRSPCVTEVEVLMGEPLGGDPTVRAAIAVADPVPG
jgi:hypothetical protein